MEKPYNNEENIMKRIVETGGLESPSPGFYDNVMKAIEEKAVKPASVYQPLISKKGWSLLVVLFLGCLVGLYLFPPDFLSMEKAGFDWDQIAVPELKFSSVMLYGIAFLSLFMLQVPFLKNYLERRN